MNLDNLLYSNLNMSGNKVNEADKYVLFLLKNLKL